MSRTIAFMDFDGTITTKDSLLEFIKFSKGIAAFYFGFALHAPFLLAYKLKIISNQRAKEMMLHYFFHKNTIDEFTGYCKDFSQNALPALIRPKAMLEIDKLQSAGAEIVIVSASPENWLRYWCESINAGCIATRLQVVNNKITGEIDGKNCYGEEKVARIRQQYELQAYSSVYCYGDSSGDRQMLNMGTIKFYKPFR